MNIFEIINNSKYADIPFVLYKGRSYAISDIRKMVLGASAKLKEDKRQKVLLVSENNFDFIIGFLGCVFAQKEIFLPSDIKKAQNLGEDFILLDKIEETVFDELCDLTAPDFNNTYITFCTSGSSGKVKTSRKNLACLMDEAKDIEDCFGVFMPSKNVKICASTSPRHMFGFAFQFFIALCNCSRFILSADEVVYPDKADIVDCIFISTPSFLDEFLKYNVDLKCAPKLIFSAGDKLCDKTLQYFKSFGVKIIEIYGSTETGTIAYKAEDGYFHCLKNVEISKDEQSQIIIKSPYFLQDEVKLGDCIKSSDNKTFMLGQRTDRILKIQEKRINAIEIEEILNNSVFVDESYCFKYENKLACAAVLSEQGKAAYIDTDNFDRTALVKLLKAHVAQKSQIVPQRWKFLYEIPKTQRGKIDREKIEEFFNLNISLPLVLKYKKDNDSACFKLFFSKNCNFFAGHFDGFPVVPGVIQLYFANKFAKEAFKCEVLESPVKKIKFSHIIKPDEEIDLKLSLEGKNISYNYCRDDIIYSCGVMEIKQQGE